MHQETEGAAPARGQGLVLRCTDTLVVLLVTGERTEGRFALIEVTERGGTSHPLHVHSREDEFVYVIEGHVRFHLQGRWFERRAGECMFLPRGQEHTYAVESELAKLLVLVAPAGLEGYYWELAQPTSGPCVYQDAERLVIIAAKQGVDITGPPPIHDNGQAED